MTFVAYLQGWTVMFSEQNDKIWEEKAEEWGKRPKSECPLSSGRVRRLHETIVRPVDHRWRYYSSCPWLRDISPSQQFTSTSTASGLSLSSFFSPRRRLRFSLPGKNHYTNTVTKMADKCVFQRKLFIRRKRPPVHHPSCKAHQVCRKPSPFPWPTDACSCWLPHGPRDIRLPT